MQIDTKTVAKNIGVLMMAQPITWALTFLVAIFLPRSLGPTAIGQLYLALSIWAIMGVLVRFGMDIYLTKAIARDPARASELLGATLALRTVLHLLGFGIVIAYVSLLGYPASMIWIVVIIGVANLIEQWIAAFTATLQGLETMEYVSIASVAGKLLFTALCLLALFLGYQVHTIAALYVVAGAATLALLFGFLWRMRLSLRLNYATTGSLLRASAPYLMASMVVVFYNEIDKQIIAALIDARSVGWYSTAATLFGTVMFVPVAFTTALFPALARNYAGASDMLSRLTRKSFDLMFIVGIAIGFGIMVIAEPLILLLYGNEFAPAGAILAVLGVVIVFVYQNILFAQVMISTDRNYIWTIVMVVSTAFTIGLDIALVPWCQQMFGNGALAGAISYLLTEAGQTVVGIFLLPKGTLAWTNVRTAGLSLLAGLVLVAVCWPLRHMFIAIPVIAGALAYTGAILLFRVVPAEDLATLKEMGYSLLGRLRLRRGEPVSYGGS